MKTNLSSYSAAEISRLRKIALAVELTTFSSPVIDVAHIAPRAFCVAKTAGHCAVFAVPVSDREPQCSHDPFTMIQHSSVESIETGDWASLAYVVTKNSGYSIVLEKLTPAKRKRRK